MSRTKGHNKYAKWGLRGKELWSRRPCAGLECSKYNRKRTARIERRADRQGCMNALETGSRPT